MVLELSKIWQNKSRLFCKSKYITRTQILTKFADNGFWDNISAKFDNQSNFFMDYKVIALDLSEVTLEVTLVRSQG